MTTYITSLKIHLQHNDVDLFFDEIDMYLSDDSDLSDLVVLLKSRYNQLKVDIIRGLLPNEEVTLQRNVLTKDLLNMLSLADEDDFKSKVIPKSIAWFYEQIQSKQTELKSVTDKKIDGVNKAGQSLVNLGKVLSGQQTSPADVPFVQLLRSASRKAHRRVVIGCEELKSTKLFQNKAFKELIKLYQDLVSYLDFPEEEIHQQQIELLKSNFEDVKRYSQNLNKSKGQAAASLAQSLPALQQLLAAETQIIAALDQQDKDNSQLKESFHLTFRNLELIQTEFTKTIDFFHQDEANTDQLIAQLRLLLSELELNIKENYE